MFANSRPSLKISKKAKYILNRKCELYFTVQKVRHHAAHDMLCPIRFLIALTPPSKLLAKTQRGTNFYKVVLFLYYFSAPNISRNIFPQFQNEVKS